jgi:hypothetical protein
MNHKDTKGTKNTEKRSFRKLIQRPKTFWNCRKRNSFHVFLGALSAFVVNFIPLWVEACPRCYAASPYRIGLIWATFLLLPVPFILMGWVAAWILHHSKSEFPPV